MSVGPVRRSPPRRTGPLRPKNSIARLTLPCEASNRSHGIQERQTANGRRHPICLFGPGSATVSRDGQARDTQEANSPAASITGDAPTIAELQALARRARLLVIETVARSGAGHVGGPLSAMDLLIALFFRVLRVQPDQPAWPERDRFVLSKGHSAIGLYTAMALRGYFPVEPSDLSSPQPPQPAGRSPVARDGLRETTGRAERAWCQDRAGDQIRDSIAGTHLEINARRVSNTQARVGEEEQEVRMRRNEPSLGIDDGESGFCHAHD